MDKLINDFSFGLFFWQTLIFVGLILLLKKFAWKPILDAVNEREQGIKDALLSAKNAKQEMQNLKKEVAATYPELIIKKCKILNQTMRN